MAGLLVDMEVGDSVSIGSAVVSYVATRGRRVRLRVEAPQDLKMEIKNKKPCNESL